MKAGLLPSERPSRRHFGVAPVEPVRGALLRERHRRVDPRQDLALELEPARLVVAEQTYVLASAVVIFAAMLSALVVRRRINQLDLVSVLKTRD